MFIETVVAVIVSPILAVKRSLLIEIYHFHKRHFDVTAGKAQVELVTLTMAPSKLF